MVAPAAGAVVLVRFPFSDLSQTKLRPAIVLAGAGRGDWILCQVTSKPYGDARAIKLEDVSFTTGSLRVTSYARRAKSLKPQHPCWVFQQLQGTLMQLPVMFTAEREQIAKLMPAAF